MAGLKGSPQKRKRGAGIHLGGELQNGICPAKESEFQRTPFEGEGVLESVELPRAESEERKLEEADSREREIQG